ncbi:MAG: biotin/lipoyl-binding protein [Dysgonamonadaceae bacterium]|jgi:biotin carboxyl carrier protein|nr:biotin/lipoyl-binding protein [Dysgonamonadaceae bacterium]
MDYKIKINGAEYEVSIHKFEGTTAHLTVNEVDFDVEIEGLVANPTRMTERVVAPSIKPVVKTTIQSEIPVATKPKTSDSGSGYQLKSPLPGIILEVLVKEGDTVKSGQQVLVLEAMKMENSIHAERGGVVEKIRCNKGDSVLEGDVILTIK